MAFRLIPSFIVAFFVGLANASAVSGSIAVQPVAVSGNAAPGTNPGVQYAHFHTPTVNSQGQLAFRADLAGPSVSGPNDVGIWTGGPGQLALAAREGANAPGGGVYSVLTDEPLLNDAGQLAFRGFNNTAEAIWSGRPGSLAPVVNSNQPVTVAGSPQFLNFIGDPVFNGSGQIAFLTAMGSTPSPGNADANILVWTGGSFSLAAQQGQPAPGTSFNYGSLASPLLNDNGQVAFRATLTGPGVTTANGTGLWTVSGSTATVIAKGADPAPDVPGAQLGGIDTTTTGGTQSFNRSGQSAFGSSATGHGVGIWAGGPGDVRLIAKHGDPAPGFEGTTFGDFGGPVINDRGQVLFTARLTDVNPTRNGDQSLWVGTPGSLTLVARQNDPAPELPAGIVFAHDPTDYPAELNNTGQLALFGRITGPGVTPANDAGLWAGDPQAGLHLVVRTGDPIDVDPGPAVDLRTISGIDLYTMSNPSAGQPTSFTDGGLLAFRLTFTDGSDGVFLASVPEPTAAATLLAGTIGLLFARRRRPNRT